jgi:hypothetical protein
LANRWAIWTVCRCSPFPAPRNLPSAPTSKRCAISGLGFRARRVRQAAQTLAELPPSWLDDLRDVSPEDANKHSCPRFLA